MQIDELSKAADDELSKAADDESLAVKEVFGTLESEDAATAGAFEVCDELIGKVKSAVPVVLGIVDSYSQDLGRSHAHGIPQQVEIARLKTRMSALEDTVKGNKRRIALGEAAYVLDEVACIYVKGGKYRRGMTIGELRMQAHVGELEDQQLARWNEFRIFLTAHSWSIGDVCTTSGVVKELRKGDAHLTAEEKQDVTLSQLLAWAEAESVQDCKDFLKLVALFCQDDKSLIIVPNVASVVILQDP
jgi:hypothetical protein